MKIDLMKKEDAPSVAQLHVAGIDRGFISSLGPDFVSKLYEILSMRDRSFVLVAREADEIVGFVAISCDIKRLYRQVIIKNWFKFLCLLGKRVFSLTMVERIYESAIYPFKKKIHELPKAELLSTAVSPAVRGKGIGTLLVKAGLEECANRHIDKVKVLVEAKNLPANLLYMKCGFEFARRIRSHGVPSNIYIADLTKVGSES